VTAGGHTLDHFVGERAEAAPREAFCEVLVVDYVHGDFAVVNWGI
jgi:hypothetical protein